VRVPPSHFFRDESTSISSTVLPEQIRARQEALVEDKEGLLVRRRDG